VEQLVTFPVERSLLGLPRTRTVRSTTKFGLSMVQVIFDDGVDPYFARQVVSERLNGVSADLPAGVRAQLGPISTAMGEVYQYILRSDAAEWDLMSLKTLQDYTIAPRLRTVAGVAEVNSWGGYIEQYHVVTEPEHLARAGLTLGDVEDAVAANNLAFGGTYTEARGERHTVRGDGRIHDLTDIGRIPVASRDGVPVLLREIAVVERGALPRQGAVTIDGEGEAVAGMVIMRKGENAREVIEAVTERVEEIRGTLPEGVELVPFYNQADLVEQTTHTIEKNLLLGATLVVILLWAFLRNIAASVIVAVVIPLSMLWAFIAMKLFGFSANLMSLGALDFGLLVDASVVMVENIMRRSRGGGGEAAVERMKEAATEVGRPVVFGVSIIMAVYLPIFALQGTERKMFVPMAFTVTAAVLGSLLLALTFVPAAARTFLVGAEEPDTPVFDRFRDRYQRLLGTTLRRPVAVFAPAVALVVVAVWSGTRLGTEFMPRLDEGSVLVQTLRPPSTALGEGVRFSGALEDALLELPEVRQVVSKLGRPDLATEAMGTYESDTYVMLRPREEWREGGKAALLAAMDSALAGVPGVEIAFTQPIQMRLDEAETGITTDVGVKIFGDDVDRLAALAGRVEGLIGTVEGAGEVRVSSAARVSELRVTLDRAALSRHGLSAGSVGHQVEAALGASVATRVVDGPRRIDVVVRLPGGNAVDPALLGRLPVAAGAALVPLDAVAAVHRREGPEAFAHEGGQRMVVVGANIRGRDVGSFVEDASALLAREVDLPEGYAFEWGGQYRNQQTAVQRLSILVPVSVVVIFLLLFGAFGTVRHAALILLNVPFALVGGIGSLWLAGLNLSTSAIIGFIAVFGIAVLNGVVMISYVNQLREEGRGLDEAVLSGAATRLRPVLMTALAASLGFVPMALSTSPGAELQRPLATVVIGGIVTSTLLTLLVLPTVYRALERVAERRGWAW
jgi:cobalt-zinc-cadmium resistance protein CzcA